eukprot:403337936
MNISPNQSPPRIISNYNSQIQDKTQTRNFTDIKIRKSQALNTSALQSLNNSVITLDKDLKRNSVNLITQHNYSKYGRNEDRYLNESTHANSIITSSQISLTKLAYDQNRNLNKSTIVQEQHPRNEERSKLVSNSYLPQIQRDNRERISVSTLGDYDLSVLLNLNNQASITKKSRFDLQKQMIVNQADLSKSLQSVSSPNQTAYALSPKRRGSPTIIQKEYLDDLDRVKKDYFNAVLGVQGECVKNFMLRNKEKTMESLEKLQELAAYAYDLEILKETNLVQAMVCVYFGQWTQAIKYFKNCRDLADELNSVEDKKVAYKHMGKCYQELKNSKCAIRCFKKLLENAWDTNDFEAEINSYEGLGIQYYYLGDLKRSQYYTDRMMRGKIEKKDSKIREIYLTQLEYRRQDRLKNSVKFVQVKEIAQRLENIKDSESILGSRKQFSETRLNKDQSVSTIKVNQSLMKKRDTVVANGFSDIYEFYTNAFSREKHPIQVRPGTPISNANSNDFPSPRIGGGFDEGGLRNYDILPNFTEDKYGRSIDSQQYLETSFKTIARQKRLKKVIPLKHSHKGGTDGSLEFITETKGPTFTKNRILRPHEEAQRLLDLQNWKLDMNEIIRKARKSNANGGIGDTSVEVNITHLNPQKSQTSQKYQIDGRSREAMNKLSEIENILNKQMKLIDFQPIHIDSLTDEHLQRITKTLSQDLTRQFVNQLQTRNFSEHKSGMPGIKLMNVGAGQSRTDLSPVQSLHNNSLSNLNPKIDSLAFVNNPKSYKIKKFNEKINQAIKTIIISNIGGINGGQSINGNFSQNGNSPMMRHQLLSNLGGNGTQSFLLDSPQFRKTSLNSQSQL